ncbi:MAG TPA: sigma-70 family RNA polymerase sigma factor, partial [Gemmataceae bacterium]
QRHGPMVLGVCRRILRQTQDAEDAFQATFLMLARGADGIRNPDAVGGWLHSVALRVAAKLRSQSVRQSKVTNQEQGVRSEESKSSSSLSADDPTEEATWKELRVVLDEELDRLPSDLRAPLVLCYLEGRTQDEGARQLGWNRRVFRRRLEKGRARLARRLARRGITLSTALFAILLSQEAPAMTAALWVPALQAAMALAAGRAGGGVSATAWGLAEGFVPSLASSKGKLVLVLLLTANLAATGLGIFVAARGGERQSPAPAARTPREPRPREPAEAAAPKGVELVGTTVVLRGRIRDNAGSPVPHARIAVLARRPYRPGEHGLRQDLLRQGEADDEGRFRLVVPADFPTWFTERQVAVLASAPGYGPGTLAVPLRAGQPNLTLNLEPNRPLRGRLVDRNGNPAVGVRMEVVRLGSALREIIQTTEEGRKEKGADETKAGPDAPFDLWPAPAKTNETGEFEFPGLGTVRNIWVQIQDDRFAVATFPVEFSDGTPIDGQPYSVMLMPGQVLQGTVAAADTGKPIPHARLTAISPIEVIAPPRHALHTVAQEAATRAACEEFDARADAAGRFRLRVPTGRFFRLQVHAPPGSPYLALSRLIDREANKERKRLDFALPRGVLLTARVRDASDRPVSGAIAYYVPDRDNRRAGGEVLHGYDAHAVSGPDGRLRLPGPPGRGRLCVHIPNGDFVPRPYRIQGEPGDQVNYAHGIRELDLSADRRTVEVDVPLRKGVSITGKVVGPDGRPVTAALLVSAQHVHPLNPSTARALPASGGNFVLPGCEAGRTYRVLFLDAERRLGAVADLTTDPREEPPVVRLQPCGQATVRFVDADGRPLANRLLTPFAMLEPDIAAGDDTAKARRADKAVPHEIAWADPWAYHHCCGHHTEADGRITLTGLVPGVRYGLMERDGARTRRVTDLFTVRPGETLRLPDVMVPPPSPAGGERLNDNRKP